MCLLLELTETTPVIAYIPHINEAYNQSIPKGNTKPVVIERKQVDKNKVLDLVLILHKRFT